MLNRILTLSRPTPASVRSVPHPLPWADLGSLPRPLTHDVIQFSGTPLTPQPTPLLAPLKSLKRNETAFLTPHMLNQSPEAQKRGFKAVFVMNPSLVPDGQGGYHMLFKAGAEKPTATQIRWFHEHVAYPGRSNGFRNPTTDDFAAWYQHADPKQVSAETLQKVKDHLAWYPTHHQSVAPEVQQALDAMSAFVGWAENKQSKPKDFPPAVFDLMTWPYEMSLWFAHSQDGNTVAPDSFKMVLDPKPWRNVFKEGWEDARITRIDHTYNVVVIGNNDADMIRQRFGHPEKAKWKGTSYLCLYQTNHMAKPPQRNAIWLLGPDENDRNPSILPVRVRAQPGDRSGKGPPSGSQDYLMVFHRLYPNVQYWFVPRFSDMTEELSPTHSTGLTHFHDSNRQRFWQYQAQPKVLERHTLLKPLPGNAWEGNHVSLSQAPIQLPNGYTDDAGWLAIYHGRDKQGVYRVGAALLDRNRPWIVTHRLPIPIMQPETPYETSPTSHQNFTITPNVMVPTGFTFDGTDILALYYGAAELHAYRATLSVQELVDQLRQYDAEGHKTQPTK